MWGCQCPFHWISFVLIGPGCYGRPQHGGDGLSCSGALLDRVSLSLERGITAVDSEPGECSVEVCLVGRPVWCPFCQWIYWFALLSPRV